MDLNLVSAFVEVVEAQSFTSAARALGLPKSSVSRRVTELERELGVPLLHRTTRKLSLTEAGRAYFAQAERALAELRNAAELASGMDAEPRGVVRMTAPVDVGVMGLPEMLADFSRSYPDIHVELCLSTRELDLREEGFDLAIRSGTSHDANLVARRIGHSRAGLFASPRYLNERGRPQTVGELMQHDAVLFRGKDGKALWQLEGPGQTTSSVEVTGRVSGNELLFIRHAIANGLGIGLLPVFVEASCAQAKKIEPLERVLPEWFVHGSELTVVTPGGPKRPRRVTLLRDYLVDHMRTKCGESPLRVGISEAESTGHRAAGSSA
jgi:DNA-binding transcriptional LysR family regulator